MLGGDKVKPLSEEMKIIIARKLEERGAFLPCPRCGNRKFAMVNGFVSPSLQNRLDTVQEDDAVIPSVVIACNRCGYLSQHALGALGLLPFPTEGETTFEASN
jgi:predicted nucleic-acid-binding Zn-ribbon protein